jgi:hypothetical protein
MHAVARGDIDAPSGCILISMVTGQTNTARFSVRNMGTGGDDAVFFALRRCAISDASGRSGGCGFRRR